MDEIFFEEHGWNEPDTWHQKCPKCRKNITVSYQWFTQNTQQVICEKCAPED